MLIVVPYTIATRVYSHFLPEFGGEVMEVVPCLPMVIVNTIEFKFRVPPWYYGYISGPHVPGDDAKIQSLTLEHRLCL